MLSARTRNWLVGYLPQTSACLSPLPLLVWFGVYFKTRAMGVVARQEFYAENFSYPGSGDILFRAFMHGAGVAAVCGEFRWQIVSSAALVVPLVAACVVGAWSCSSGGVELVGYLPQISASLDCLECGMPISK